MRSTLVPVTSVLSLLLFTSSAGAEILQVGPGKPYAAPCAAIAAAAAGDTIEIDAAGTYSGDVCAWGTDNLTIKGVNGRPKIDANGQASQGKAIWVIGGDNTTIENVELTGATVPDQNGAGIRQEGKNLTVRGTYFHDNEDGILAGDNDGSEILIEGCEFGFNGFGDGYSHNLYINHVAKLIFRYNYSHDCKEGHLVKSRAAENHILYNRLTQENGSGSYEIDLSNGGLSYIIGNLIQQGPSSNNSNLVSYAGEGASPSNPSFELFVVNNTFVNQKGPGTFVNIGGAVDVPAVIRNNIFAGSDSITGQATAILEANFSAKDGDPLFVNLDMFDYHLQDGSPCKDGGVDPGTGAGMSLLPVQHYVHPASSEGRTSVGAIDIGAYEIGGGTGGSGGSGGGSGGSGAAGGGGQGGGQGGSGGAGNGGSGASGAAGGAGGGAGGEGGSGGGGGDGSGDEGGCGCRAAGESPAGGTGAAAGLLLGLSLLLRRRRGA